MKSVLVSALGITMLMAAGTAVQAKHGSEKSLPPGLQKKAQSGKPLPPRLGEETSGWPSYPTRYLRLRRNCSP